MKFLLFLLWISYFFLFFFLFNNGIESDNFSNFWQWQIYIIITFLCILYTLEMKSFKSKKNIFPEIQIKKSVFLLKNQLKKNLYFIGIFFLYASFYFILHGYFWNIHINLIFFLVNLGTFFVYYISQKSPIIYNIIQWNTIIVSLYYSILHIFFLFWGDIFFTLIDIWNLILISLLFILLFLSDREKEILYYTAIHALIFYILEISILFYFIIPSELFIFSIILLFSLIIHIFFYFPDKLSLLSYIPKIFFLRYGNILSVNLILLYILWLIYFHTFLLFSTILILIHSVYLFLYYKNFIFFPSLIFSIIWVISCIVWIFIHIFWLTVLLINISFIFLIFSLWVFIFPYIKKYIIFHHQYSLHFMFLGINIIWCILFFVFRDFSVLSFWYLLFFEALYFIGNSYLFKKLY